LDHGHQAAIDIVDIRQFKTDTTAQASAREVEQVIDPRGHAADVGSDLGCYQALRRVGESALE
jgi:hypothetical protein